MQFPAPTPAIDFFDFFGGTVPISTKFEIFLTEVIDSSSAKIVIKLVIPSATTLTLPLEKNKLILEKILTPETARKLISKAEGKALTKQVKSINL